MRSALFCVLGGPWGGILAGWLGGLAGRLGWAGWAGRPAIGAPVVARAWKKRQILGLSGDSVKKS